MNPSRLAVAVLAFATLGAFGLLAYAQPGMQLLWWAGTMFCS